MDAQLRAQLKQTINVALLASVTTRGDPVFGAPVAVSARIEDYTEETESPAGSFFVTRKRIITETAMSVRDRLWMPGDPTSDATLARSPERVTIAVNERGLVDHYELIV